MTLASLIIAAAVVAYIVTELHGVDAIDQLRQ